MSDQIHYDWGLRALKTVLMVAGQLIQQERRVSKDVTKETEVTLLIKAIRINTLSKLTFSDINRFIALLSDVFPDAIVKDIQYAELSAAIVASLKDLKLDFIPKQVEKILQFHEATKQRIGVVLVGASGCGKTTIWKVLKNSYEKLGLALKTYIMNPKSMLKTQLLGLMKDDTREFVEGVLTLSAKNVIKESREV